MKGGGNLYNEHKVEISSKDSKGTSTSSSLDLADDDNKVVDKVTCEILSRLPVRSLIRFKCVSKPWRFLLEKDPYFRDLHLSQSTTRSNLFFVVDKPSEEQIYRPVASDTYEGVSRKVFLITGDYLFDEGRGKSVANIHTIREIDVPYFARFFGPLNGLVGFHDHEYYSGVLISNVCTQVTTPWMKSTLLRKYDKKKGAFVKKANCQLGFDPTTKEHKVVCIWNIKYIESPLTNGLFCEVLTIGEHEWRRIDDVPSNVLYDDHIRCSIYVNGSIYYSTFNFMKRHSYDSDKIVVFDVGREKFRTIKIPNFIVDQSPIIDDNNTGYYIDFLEMDGRFAVLCRINGYLVKLWLYDDDVDDEDGKICWREVIIELPFGWDKERHLTFHSVAGKNEMIIKSYQCYVDEDGAYRMYNLFYFSYNWRKQTLTQMEINGIPSAIHHIFSGSSFHKTFVESLLPVR